MGLFDRLRRRRGPRVAFIGIDGVPFSLVADNPDVFPNLTDIAETGTGTAMESIVPPESSACWPSLTTGVNPGKTGVYGFQDREAGSYETYVPIGQDVQAKRIWDRVHEAGRRATVMNVPVTFPPQRTIQRMVAGFLSPSVDKAAYPDELRTYLEEISYVIDVDAKLGHDEDKTAFIQDAYDTVDVRAQAFSHYLEKDDWDLFFGVFMTTDRVNHFLFRDYERHGTYADEFIAFYQHLDEHIGRLRRIIPEDASLIIASDHGFTSLEYEVHMNEWLREEGWLGFQGSEPSELADVTNETRAYSLIPGRFYLNLENREPRGCVPEAEYESTRDALQAGLSELKGPDGTPVCERVYAREEVFDGDHTDIAPDLVALPNRGFDLKAGFNGDHPVFDVGPRNGMHTFDNAAFFADTPGLDRDPDDLLDIAPTLLSLMDIQFDPNKFDGQPLT